MSEKILFTGERYIPEYFDNNNDEIISEHESRYRSISSLINNKVVLDAACGSGYGSFEISKFAKNVIGIDISNESIEYCKDKFKSNNLSYEVASVTELPFENDKFDIVISFETIEHISEDQQYLFLSQVKRVLKKDGCFVVSTPDKLIYSDKKNYKNEFHIKEFYEEEFYVFLNKFFKNIKFYYQSDEICNLIYSSESKEIKISEIKNSIIKGKYIIAVCSNEALNDDIYLENISIDNNKLINLQNRILELQVEVEEKNNWAFALIEELKQKDQNNEEIKQMIKKLKYRKWKKTIEKSELFDSKYYLFTYPDVRKADIDPIKHYINQGWKEGRNPSEKFDNNKYLENNPDLKNKNICPLFHKIKTDNIIKKGQKLKTFKNLILNLNKLKKHFSKHNFQKLIYHIKKGNLSLINEKIGFYTNTELKKMDLNLIESNVYEKIVFEKISNPKVSIVIPVYNQFEYTYKCLKSILENTKDIEYEIIIADDVSSDETIDIINYAENIIVVRNENNLGFLLNCNNAAKHASGKYIHFLNNDTQVQLNWLSSLVELIESDLKIGMVGSKLVYPDGRQQEAGGIIWNDASGWNFGRLDDPSKPEYNYVKEVDYISGASIMIKKDLWKEIGGFDERYVPAYYEDSDLAFEVRKHGYKVMFQPKSVVVHFEGISNGTDLGSGIKKYQVVNNQKFKEKWKDELEKNHFPNAENVFFARDRSKDKKHMLFIDHYLPHYDQDAGSKVAHQYLKLFSKSLNIKFIGDNFYDYPGTPYLTALTDLGIEVLYGTWYNKNWENWIKENGKYFEYIVISRPHISIKYIDIIKEYTNAKIIYFGHDLHFLREKREYNLKKEKIFLKNSEKWKDLEFELMNKVDASYFFSDVEKQEINQIDKNLYIDVVPLYIYESFDEVEYIPEKRKDIMFVGGFRHGPNVDAMIWFVKEIWPKIQENIPEIHFYIIGSNPPDEILKLSSNSITVTGFISDEELSVYYSKVKLVVAPLRFGAGVKGKIIDSLYNGMPLVTTTVGAEGILKASEIMNITDNSDLFAEKVVDLYVDDLELKRLSKISFDYCKENFSINFAIKQIKKIIKEVESTK